jgi:hypothetical protein
MSQTKSYVNDIGTVILLDCGTSIADATVTNILVLKPDKIEYVWPGVIYNDKYIKYVIVSGDFNLRGKYLLQAYVETPAWQGRGETVELVVYEKFK